MRVLLGDLPFPGEYFYRVFPELALVEKLQGDQLVASGLPQRRDDQAERALAEDAVVLEPLGEEALFGPDLEHLLPEELLELVGPCVARHSSIFARGWESIINS